MHCETCELHGTERKCPIHGGGSWERAVHDWDNGGKERYRESLAAAQAQEVKP